MARQRLDADRLAAAYERDGRRLLVFFTRRTYDAQLAVDLVAETYARAFERRRRFAADPADHDAPAAWVFSIARNVLIRSVPARAPGGGPGPSAGAGVGAPARQARPTPPRSARTAGLADELRGLRVSRAGRTRARAAEGAAGSAHAQTPLRPGASPAAGSLGPRWQPPARSSSSLSSPSPSRPSRSRSWPGSPSARRATPTGVVDDASRSVRRLDRTTRALDPAVRSLRRGRRGGPRGNATTP
jgi:DNA-directed RNA polymerase specialized sigma24 family protein